MDDFNVTKTGVEAWCEHHLSLIGTAVFLQEQRLCVCRNFILSELIRKQHKSKLCGHQAKP